MYSNILLILKDILKLERYALCYMHNRLITYHLLLTRSFRPFVTARLFYFDFTLASVEVFVANIAGVPSLVNFNCFGCKSIDMARECPISNWSYAKWYEQRTDSSMIISLALCILAFGIHMFFLLFLDLKKDSPLLCV